MMKKHFLKIFIILITILAAGFHAEADSHINSKTRFRIEKLSPSPITIGNKQLKPGDTFSAGDMIKWNDPKQSMLVKDLSTHGIMRFSKRMCDKKGTVNSILDFIIQINKGSTRGINSHIQLDKSPKASDFPEKRIALVVGNQNYMYIAPLKSAQKDAEDISETLSDLGFDVLELYETDYSDLMAGVNKFSGLAKDYDVAVFYYAGHGIQEDGVNYLVPVDNMQERIQDLRDCVSCSEIVQKLENSGCPSKIFYFDACRDRKTTWSRSGDSSGLSSMEGGPGTVIAFATQSGKVAADGDRDDNSPFAKMLIKNIKTPKVSFDEMMASLIRDTYNITNKRQYPIRQGSLINDFRFNPQESIEQTRHESIRKATQESVGKISQVPTVETSQAPDEKTTLTEVKVVPGNKNTKYTSFDTPTFSKALELDKAGKYEEAMLTYLKEKDNPWCQLNIGVLYEYGRGVTKDYKTALDWYRKAAEQEDEIAQCNLANHYYNGTSGQVDYENAFKWYMKSAQKGYADAQTMIGVMYEEGKYVPKDAIKAMEWSRKGADQGNAIAQYNLANNYYYGTTGQTDYENAFMWYMKSAQQGYARAQNMIGSMFDDGKYVPKNPYKAIEWYNMAARQGNAIAQYNLAKNYYYGTTDDVDYENAYKWYLKAAQQGHSDAQIMIGGMYKEGEYVAEDINKCIEWYSKAADQGHLLAQYYLARNYYYGNFGKVDYENAYKWYLRAAQQGHSYAQYMIGICYYNGQGISVDKLKAKEWMEKAASADNKEAKEFISKNKFY